MKIFGLRAEALLKLNRHQEAIETMEKSPNFDIDLCIKFFGPVGSSSLLVFQAQVDLASGRLELFNFCLLLQQETEIQTTFVK